MNRRRYEKAVKKLIAEYRGEKVPRISARERRIVEADPRVKAAAHAAGKDDTDEIRAAFEVGLLGQQRETRPN